VGWQEGLQSRSAGRYGGVSRADRYRREFLTTRPTGRYGKESRAGQYRWALGQVDMGGGGWGEDSKDSKQGGHTETHKATEHPPQAGMAKKAVQAGTG
jgi:hypothetical protein